MRVESHPSTVLPPSWLKRSSGILLHISSLPSEFGIGDFGPSAYRWVDFLAEAGQQYWQILPMNPTLTVYGNSPYSSISTFAGNPLFINPWMLAGQGWLDEGILKNVPAFPAEKVDYLKAAAFKEQLWDAAYEKSRGRLKTDDDFKQFVRDQAFWLEDFSLFVVLKQRFGGRPWNQWPEEFKRRESGALRRIQDEEAEQILRAQFLQYLCSKQWRALKKYCGSRNVKVIGDIPIYVNYDSADVWARPGLFKLKEDFEPEFVAGVPPDYFSATGQRWGNPVYNWDEHRRDGFSWWIQRIEHKLALFDVIRIDHFRGLVAFWQIPASEQTAVRGEWVPVPGDEFFGLLQKKNPRVPIIAEDLGIITPDVTAAMNRYGFPGMKVLLFAFDGDLSTHPYIPENYHERCVVYTGTHDNNTVRGWYSGEASPEAKKNLVKYFKKKPAAARIAQLFVETALASRADLAIFPLQDILGLGEEARMNIPGTTQNNWQWRAREEDLTSPAAHRLARQTAQTHRNVS